jgi:hypothetical protein
MWWSGAGLDDPARAAVLAPVPDLGEALTLSAQPELATQELREPLD